MRIQREKKEHGAELQVDKDGSLTIRKAFYWTGISSKREGCVSICSSVRVERRA